MTAEDALAMGELTIKAERACEACDGTGRVVHELWRTWHESHAAAGSVGRAATGVDYERRLEAFFGEHGESPDEVPEEHDCLACDGSGRAEVEVTIGEIGRWTLEMVPVAVIDRGELEDMIATVKERMLTAASRSEGIGVPDRERAVASAEWLRVVQEGAHTLRELTALLIERRSNG
jgi:hypothetical protein